MNKKQILKRLCNDEDYYGEFGNQFLSNSHIGKLLKDPLRAFEPSKPSQIGRASCRERVYNCGVAG